jgi:hypothetical protein
MASETLANIEKKIRRLKRQLAGVGDLRPGTLSVQYRNPAQKKTPFTQISYTRKGQSRSEYVRPENVQTVRREIDAYKRLKSILDQLIDLSIEASRLRCGTRATPRPAPTGPPRPPGCT